MSKVRWGLVGTARINRSIMGAIRESRRGELVAVASRQAATATAYATEWEIPHAVSPYESLLQRDDVDAVYIGLPNSMHVEWSVRALNAGKHVLCEKPLALTPEGVDEIARASKQHARVAAEGFMYRHHPLTRAVLDVVESGTLGPVRLIRGAFSFSLVGRTPDIRTDALLGGGSLWDVGCYPASYACLVEHDEPKEVIGWQVTGDTGIDLTFAAMMRFKSGAIAQFDCGFQSPYRAEMEIVGGSAALRIDLPFKAGPDSRLRLTRGSEESQLAFPADPPYLGEVEDFHASVLDGAPHPLRLEESRRTARVLTALYASASSGGAVRL